MQSANKPCVNTLTEYLNTHREINGVGSDVQLGTISCLYIQSLAGSDRVWPARLLQCAPFQYHLQIMDILGFI